MTTFVYVRRHQWGAKYGRGSTNVWPQRGGAACHYNGGRIPRGNHSRCAARVRAIERHHVEGNRWAGIAYTDLVCEHGVVFEGRGLGRRTAAQGTNDGNNRFYAIMFLIGGDQKMTAAQRRTGRALILKYRRRGAGREVRPHSYFTATSCPGASVRSWIREGFPAGGGASSGGAAGPYETYNRKANPGKRVLRLYSAGEDVKAVQRAVGAEVDGYYGPQSTGKVRVYQRKHGLAVDGITGPQTWGQILGKRSSSKSKSKRKAPRWPGRYLRYPPTTKSRMCRRWQKRMRRRGWRITVDGWYGQQSQQVCLAFQAEKGLTQDGVVGPQTWAAAWEAPIT